MSSTFTKESTYRAAQDFKFAFHEAMAYAGEKQESLALQMGVSQAQVNNWTNINSDRNFPMGLFPLLPAKMQYFLMDHLNKAKETAPVGEHLNGSIDDELVHMILLESDLKRASESDPQKVRQALVKMKELIGRMERELSVREVR